MAAIAEQDAGVVFRNRVTVNSNETQEIEDGPSYNILYPVFTILGVSPTSQTIVSGASTQRTIQIINGGNGKTDLVKVTDVRNDPVLSLTAVDVGTLSGDTIVLTSTDFASIGNGDGYFDQYETITITETLSGTSCTDVTVTSSIRTHWGCGDQISTSTSYAHVTLDFQNPNLAQSATETINSCFGAGNASVQELLIRNTGSGMASGITADLFKSLGSNYDESIFSRFDVASLQLKQGANGTYAPWTDLTSYATSNAGDYACLGSNPIGRMLVNLPDMAPGDSIYLRWDMYSCCLQTCSDDKVQGWRAELDYTDVCAVQAYSSNSTQQGTNSQSIEFYTESPIEVYPSQLADFVFTVSGFSNDLPEGDGAHYEVVIDLDNGLNYNGLAFNSNGNTWTPFSTDHDVANNTITASFATPAPFTLTRSELVLTVSGTSGPSGNQQIDLDFAYVPDTTCTTCSIPLMCTQSTDTYLDAASGGAGSCSSLGVLDFSVERISFGLPDNNFDGIADGSGSLDMTKVKALRAMVGDTLQAISRAVVGTTSSTWAYAGHTSTIEYGSVLTPIAATVRLYDASAATAYTISGLTATTAVNGNELEVTYDLSASVLAGLEPALSGYAFASGDSVTLTVDYRVAASVDDRWQQATFYNNMYLSSVANPTDAQKDYCTERDGRLTLLGYAWRNNNSNNLTVNSCTRVVSQNFGMAIGPGSNNYGGGNLFPYEYRHWGILKEAWAVIPAHYSAVNSTLRQTRTKATNSTQNQSDNSVSPDAINGDTLYYNVAQYYSNGTFNRSDDGFNGRIQVELAPSCDVPQNTYQDIVWLFNYEKSTAIDGAESGTVTASGPDKIRYSPSALELSSDNPRIDANTRQVSWNYKVKNASSSGADHAWLHLVVPQNI
ncbi:MAG: hypothetical protein AAGB22_04405, partial [Bacteroidota bacterium]